MSGDGEDGGGFLARWSRRKRQAETPAREPSVSETDAASSENDEPFDPDKLAIPLPSIDDLKPGDTLVAFMQKGVPDVIRNAALRKMWALDPMVRDFRSEALDYAWDWNTPGGVPGSGPLGIGDRVEEIVEALFSPPKTQPEEVQAMADDSAIASSDEVVEPIQHQELTEKTEENTSVGEADIGLPVRRHGGAMPQV